MYVKHESCAIIILTKIGGQVIQLAFLVTIANPELNFANAGNNCTLFPGTNLFSCPQMA